jgi:hypothetical protein
MVVLEAGTARSLKKKLRGSTAVIEKKSVKSSGPGTPVIERVNQVLGYDVLLAEGVERFAAEDAAMAESDMAAQADNLEPYDE